MTRVRLRWVQVSGMARVALTLGIVMAARESASAQDQPAPPRPRQAGVVELEISPASEPVPALKYRLLPPQRERLPGNAALYYHRALLTLHDSLPSAKPAQELQSRIQDWLSTPLDKLPIADVEKTVVGFRQVLAELERGARCERCDWQVPIELDGIATTMPEIQSMRNAVRVLGLSVRLKTAKGDFPGAIRSVQACLQISRHLNDGKTMISALVGSATAAVALGQLESLVQQPGAPNLYWALTDLPTPLIDLRDAFESEYLLLDREFPQLARFRSQTLPLDEARRLTDEILERWANAGLGDEGPKTLEGARIQFMQTSLVLLPAARRHLMEEGRTPEQIDAMPVPQIVMLELERQWDVANQAVLKWSRVPEPFRSAGWNQEVQLFSESCLRRQSFQIDFNLLRPAIEQGGQAGLRRDRQIAMLRIVEAIRLHAAQEKGQLPDSLEAIKVVPIPTDPATSQPFLYTVANGAATLEGTPFPGVQFRYLIRLRP